MPQNSPDLASISVHLGAFATSALALQSTLKLQKSRLQRQGVCYLGPDQLRGPTGLLFPGGRENRSPSVCADHNDAAIRTLIKKHQEHYPLKHLILSDGALLGSARRLTVDGKLYPDAKENLSVLPAWIDSEATTVFLSVRHKGDLVAEEVCRVAMRRALPDISRIEDVLWSDLTSWSTVVAWVHAHFSKSKSLLWRHEDFEQVSASVVRALTNGTLNHLKQTKPSELLSARAMRYLQSIADPTGKVDMPTVRARYAMKHFPVSPEFPLFSIGTSTQQRYLDTQYEYEWSEITGMWPDSILSIA
ncbi:hypothetical protein [Tateyamaria sp. ANG-S1]|uniref:hypothetical protein n=1 Tax=Tateyamaria sp. ANG-S1 TaxID=1577905 RepID=UPI001269DF37|nr:hypothetical protein [Tateyamaria sp. ANG-S1]